VTVKIIFVNKVKIMQILEIVAALIEGLREISSNSDKDEFSVHNINVEEALNSWMSILHGLTFCNNGEAAISKQ
jgi:hypothetical protein